MRIVVALMRGVAPSARDPHVSHIPRLCLLAVGLTLRGGGVAWVFPCSSAVKSKQLMGISVYTLFNETLGFA